MKWLLDVKLLDFYGDFRFAISVYNVPEDFVFRTRDEESCREWVATLISAKESSNAKKATDAAAEVNFPDLLGQQQEQKHRPSNPSADTRTSTNNHNKSNPVKKNGANGSQHSSSDSAAGVSFPDLDMDTGNPKPSAPPMDHEPKPFGGNGTGAFKDRMSIKELRAIAHGAGYDTRGMERSDLEKIAAYYAPMSEKTAQQSQKPNPDKYSKQQAEIEQTRKAAEEERIRKELENERIRKQQQYVEEKRQEAMKRHEELQRQTEQKSHSQNYHSRVQQPPQPQPSQSQQPQPQSHQPQQNNWQPQHSSNWNNPTNAYGAPSATSSPRRSHPDQNMFESTRFFNYETKSGESGPRRKYPFPSQQPQPQPQPQPKAQTQPQPQPQPSTQQRPSYPQFSSSNAQRYSSPPDPPAATTTSAPPPQFHHSQRTTTYPNSPPQPPPPPPPPQHSQPSSNPQNSNQQRTCDPTSPLNQKYAKVMAANQSTSSAQDEQAVITSIKRNILITWALVPPQYNMLRPIDQLLSSIHTVFPPFSSVTAHEYFTKWQPISHTDLLLGSAMSGADESKLKKAVRKLRVFLHPDRLPKEFDSKQSFVCKMLWDVSNDAYEEFLKSKEDLDWVGS
jgi:hypothetical protein